MKVIQILALLPILSCTSLTAKLYSSIEKYRHDYVTKYKGPIPADLSITLVDNLPYGSLDKPLIAVCSINRSTGSRRIFISFPKYLELTPLERTSVVWHELAHCVTLREHVNVKLPDACPASLMYPSLISYKCLDTHWDYYVREMFEYSNPFFSKGGL